MDTSPETPVDSAEVAKTPSPIGRLIGIVLLAAGLGLLAYGIYVAFLRRPVVPPGVPPLSDVPLIDPAESPKLLSHGVSTSTTVADSSAAVEETPTPEPVAIPPEQQIAENAKPEATTQAEPERKPEKRAAKRADSKSTKGSRDAKATRTTSKKPSASKRKPAPEQSASKTPATRKRPERRQERVPSAFEQLMRSRASRAGSTGVSMSSDTSTFGGVAKIGATRVVPS